MENDTIKIIQEKELNLLREFIRICQRHQLKYYIVGGTLLGAVRHRGFIPWDDDIDVAMPREDYEKFMQLDLSEFKSPYKLVHEKNTPSFTKAFMNLQDTSTTILMTYSQEKHEESLWIDIFPVDGMPKNPIKKWIHSKRYLLARMMVQLSQFNKIVNQNKKNRPLSEKIIIKLAKWCHIEKILNYNFFQKYYINTISKYSMNEYYAGNFAGAYKLKEIVPSSFFGEGTLLEFSGVSVNAPSRYAEYLTAIYGETYMQLPPEENRQPHQYDIIHLGD